MGKSMPIHLVNKCEMGVDFPKPIPLQMDNTTAEAFANNNAKKTKLKHIDARQEWIKVLRDKSIALTMMRAQYGKKTKFLYRHCRLC